MATDWDWFGKDVITTRGMPVEAIEQVLKLAKKMDGDRKSFSHALDGLILATLFYEPSTRTQFSFQTAMKRLGGDTIGFTGTSGTSVQKGETVHDTIKLVDACADAIVLRHFSEGAAAYAAKAAKHPVINAGDGSNQHPSQTMLDLFTVMKEKGKIDGLTILMVGDLKFGRTVHSLSYALSNFDVKIILSSPPALKMPPYITNEVRNKAASVREVEDIPFEEADVVYATRVQKERFADPEEHKKYAYRIGLAEMDRMQKDALLLHPFPRVDEIDPAVDSDPRAAYFRQEANGVPTRMALLDLVMGRD
jgi:aspartate carbamoyltransferase catalytic subunit